MLAVVETEGDQSERGFKHFNLSLLWPPFSFTSSYPGRKISAKNSSLGKHLSVAFISITSLLNKSPKESKFKKGTFKSFMRRDCSIAFISKVARLRISCTDKKIELSHFVQHSILNHSTVQCSTVFIYLFICLFIWTATILRIYLESQTLESSCTSLKTQNRLTNT